MVGLNPPVYENTGIAAVNIYLSIILLTFIPLFNTVLRLTYLDHEKY